MVMRSYHETFFEPCREHMKMADKADEGTRIGCDCGEHLWASHL